VTKQYYITTPLYYVNSPLTVGGAYTTIVADVLARYQRLRGREVFFLTGSDEHGQKIQRAAEKEGLTPRKLADRVVGTFLELWQLLEISNSDFIRTTEKRHEDVVRKVFSQLEERGDIYWGAYEGWYCTPCETFLLESNLVEGKCPQCARPVERLAEENYFFRLTRYQEQLRHHFSRSRDFVMPPSRFREVFNRLEEGLNDISVSRAGGWGIPVPGRPEQTIWVWFDALLNYISALDPFSDEGLFNTVWPADIHLMAKDILWFHSILWPAMLLALELPLPRRIFAHGWWTMGGEKISKSKGKTVSAREMVEKFGPDPFRYFMLREIPLGGDGDFSFEALAGRYRSDLAHDLGNLLQRSLSMVKKYRGGKIPGPGRNASGGNLLKKTIGFWGDYHRLMEDLLFNQALEGIWTLVKGANRFIEERKPWKLARDPLKADRLDETLFTLSAVLLQAAAMIRPFMPGTAAGICRQLNPDLKGPPEFSEAASRPMEILQSGGAIGRIEPLFPLEEGK